jgi:hypothetical protein
VGILLRRSKGNGPVMTRKKWGIKGGAMLPVHSPGGTRVCDIPPEPTRSRVRARPRGSRPAAWPPAQRVALTRADRGALKFGRGLVASCRGTLENQATGIVTRRDEMAKPARASGTRGKSPAAECGSAQ